MIHVLKIIIENAKTKKLINENILFAIDSIREDIQRDADPENAKNRADAIKTLADAYAMVNGVK